MASVANFVRNKLENSFGFTNFSSIGDVQDSLKIQPVAVSFFVF
jgi:hypothetical protein